MGKQLKKVIEDFSVKCDELQADIAKVETDKEALRRRLEDAENERDTARG